MKVKDFSSFGECFQLFFVGDLNTATGQLYDSLVLKIPQHPRNHFPGVSQVVTNGFVGDF